MRGEKVVVPQLTCIRCGSSPLARGKASAARAHGPGPRIIPACAGKSHMGYSWLASVQDHPRLRGEKQKPPDVAQAVIGSSPLARGKASPAKFEFISPRIIPACAGKRITARARHAKSRGSSPLARGKAVSSRADRVFSRIIPACAGKSFPHVLLL